MAKLPQHEFFQAPVFKHLFRAFGPHPALFVSPRHLINFIRIHNIPLPFADSSLQPYLNAIFLQKRDLNDRVADLLKAAAVARMEELGGDYPKERWLHTFDWHIHFPACRDGFGLPEELRSALTMAYYIDVAVGHVNWAQVRNQFINRKICGGSSLADTISEPKDWIRTFALEFVIGGFRNVGGNLRLFFHSEEDINEFFIDVIDKYVSRAACGELEEPEQSADYGRSTSVGLNYGLLHGLIDSLSRVPNPDVYERSMIWENWPHVGWPDGSYLQKLEGVCSQALSAIRERLSIFHGNGKGIGLSVVEVNRFDRTVCLIETGSERLCSIEHKHAMPWDNVEAYQEWDVKGREKSIREAYMFYVSNVPTTEEQVNEVVGLLDESEIDTPLAQDLRALAESLFSEGLDVLAMHYQCPRGDAIAACHAGRPFGHFVNPYTSEVENTIESEDADVWQALRHENRLRQIEFMEHRRKGLVSRWQKYVNQ